jgi:molecular chaperone DnaJ
VQLSGKVSFDPGRHPVGQDFRLKGKGIKGVRSGFAGDLFCHVSRDAGQADRKQKELLRFEKSTTEGGAKHSPQTKTWRDKVKDFFE